MLNIKEVDPKLFKPKKKKFDSYDKNLDPYIKGPFLELYTKHRIACHCCGKKSYVFDINPPNEIVIRCAITREKVGRYARSV